MRTRMLAVLPASTLAFGVLPLHDLEVADYAALAALRIEEHGGKLVLVKATGEVFRYDARNEARNVFVSQHFTGGTSSAITAPREEQIR